MMMTYGSLFSGIGGFDLGLERAGLTPVWQVEIDHFCQKVLAKHWPDVKKFKDIKDCGGHNLESVDLVCGGFPCQPYSVAGKQRGSEDDRALWPEMLRVIEEAKPRWVVGENVTGIISMEFDKVLSDLESIGYETQAFVIPACAVNAPHRRDRVWIVANSNSTGLEKLNTSAITERQGLNTWIPSDAWSDWPAQSPVCGRDDGISNRMDRLRALGNAIVPQIAEIIGRLILKTEGLK